MRSHYLYAIVDRLPARWRPPVAGLTGAPVETRHVQSFVVVGSLLEVVPPLGPRTLAEHQDVISTLQDAGATLPMAYGTAVPSASLPRWLAAHRVEVTAALAAVSGCVEMSVRLLRLAGSGDGGLRTLAESLAERAALPDWQYRASGRGSNVTASVAFLVPRGEIAGFLARIAPVASHAAGVAVVPTGPWPPYSFVPQLDRAHTSQATECRAG